MSPIYLYNGKILLNQAKNKIATNESCCCALSPTPTPTITRTPAPSPIVPGEDCDCAVVLGGPFALNNSISASVTLFRDNGGVGLQDTWITQGNIPLQFQGDFGNIILSVGGQVAVPGGTITGTASRGCITVNGNAVITLTITLNGDGSQFCDQDLTVPFVQMVLRTSTPELECNQNGFVNIAGNYNLGTLFTVPPNCGNGNASWDIS